MMEDKLLLLNKLATRLSYKPGYNFLVRQVNEETVLVSLRCPSLADSRQANDEVGLTINNTVKLSQIATLSDALQAFAQVVASLELHEAAEWFKVDNRQVFLPHGWGDDFGGFSWTDFSNLNGKFLSALKDFLETESKKVG